MKVSSFKFQVSRWASCGAAIWLILPSAFRLPPSAYAADVLVSPRDLQLGTLPSRTATLTPVAAQVNGSYLVVLEPRTLAVTNGAATFTNVVAGNYRLNLSGAPPTALRLLVPETNGTVNAAALVVVDTNAVVAGSTTLAWSAGASDARYPQFAWVTNYIGTNVTSSAQQTNWPSSSITNQIQPAQIAGTLTNSTTGSASYAENANYANTAGAADTASAVASTDLAPVRYVGLDDDSATTWTRDGSQWTNIPAAGVVGLPTTNGFITASDTVSNALAAVNATNLQSSTWLALSNNAGTVTVRSNLVVNNWVGIGAAPTAPLSVNGGDNASNGPLISLFGAALNQVESGRIRFTELPINSTNIGSLDGGFIHYDGLNNVFNLGVHLNNTNDAALGINAITIQRTVNARVGIANTNPAAQLDVTGSIGCNGIASVGTVAAYTPGTLAAAAVRVTYPNVGLMTATNATATNLIISASGVPIAWFSPASTVITNNLSVAGFSGALSITNSAPGSAPLIQASNYMASVPAIVIATNGDINISRSLVLGNTGAGGRINLNRSFDGTVGSSIQSTADGEITIAQLRGGTLTSLVIGEAKSFFAVGNVGIGLTNPSTRLHVAGTVTASNMVFAVTNATVRPLDLTRATNLFEDINFQPSAMNPAGTAGAAALVADAGPDALMFAIDFAASGTTVIGVNPQMQHSWTPGTLVFPHVHVLPKTANNGNVVWKITAISGDIGSTVITNYSGTVTNTLAGGTNQHRHLLWDLPESGMQMTNFVGPSTMMLIRLERLGGDPADTYADPISVIGFDIHARWGGSPVPYVP